MHRIQVQENETRYFDAFNSVRICNAENTYLLLTEFEVRTVSYGPSVEREKNEDP